jgi:hypothetical protein
MALTLPYNQSNYMQPSQFYQQPYRYEQPQQPILKGRPVASIEEARASMIDFDGSTFYFPDAAKKNIYTKRINMDGTSSLDVYTLQEKSQVPETQYVTMETFQSTINALIAKFENLQSQGVQNNDEQFKF